jgi:hypothetical protein
MLVREMWANRALSQIQEISAKTVNPDSLTIKNKSETQQNLYWYKVESTSRQYQYRFFPLGWIKDDTDCTIENLRECPSTFFGWINKFFGLVFTASMVSLGADFWFKILERYIKVKV